jgi:hypothetical protein
VAGGAFRSAGGGRGTGGKGGDKTCVIARDLTGWGEERVFSLFFMIQKLARPQGGGGAVVRGRGGGG